MLRGVNVIEFAGLAPGPFCGKILKDLGARVIRIDRLGGQVQDTLAHGKESIALNLKQKESIDIIKKLTSRSDVLIEPFRKGVMEKIGLGPEVLCSQNPKLIYARLTGYGQSGPAASKGGHDINYLGYSGLLSALGRANEKPYAPINLLADFAGGGLMCALGILGALYERTQTSKGKVLDTSMVEGAAYVGSWIWSSKEIPSVWEGSSRGTNLLDGGYPAYETYETKDGKFMAVGALEPQFHAQMLKGLELDGENLTKDLLEKRFKTKTRDEWEKVFESLDACVTPVLDMNEAHLHEHNKERKSFLVLKNGILFPKMNWHQIDESEANLRLPDIGEHTTKVLVDLGYTSEQIKKFEENNVVRQQNPSSKL